MSSADASFVFLDGFLQKFRDLSFSNRPKVSKICRFLDFHHKDLALKAFLETKESVKPFTLPAEWSEKVKKKIENAVNSTCIVIVGKCTIGMQEIQRLQPGNWLNDQIVDGYLFLIGEASKGTVHAFNCFFWQKVQRGDWAGLAAYTRRWKVKVWEKQLLLFPIAIANTHWALCAVDMQRKSISYYDSLVATGKGCRISQLFENVMHFLQDEAVECAVEMRAEEWEFQPATSELPQQHNGNDCGVFLCVFAAYLAKRRKFDFGQQQMAYFRQKITFELLHCMLVE